MTPILFFTFLGCFINGQKTPLPLGVMTPYQPITIDEGSIVTRVDTMTHYKGQLLISDWDENRILQLDPQFKPRKIFGSTGDGPGEVRGPAHFYTKNDLLFILSDARRQIEVFDLAGNFIQRVPLPSYIGMTNFAVDSENQIYISEPILGAEISVFDLKGDLINQIALIENANTRDTSDSYSFLGVVQSNRHEQVISVGLVKPVIKIHRTDGNLVSSIDLSSDPYFSDLLQYKKETAKQYPDALVAISRYMAICEDKLLILLHNRDSFVHLLVSDIKDEEIEPLGIYRLQYPNQTRIAITSVTYSKELGWIAFDRDEARLIRLKPDRTF